MISYIISLFFHIPVHMILCVLSMMWYVIYQYDVIGTFHMKNIVKSYIKSCVYAVIYDVIWIWNHIYWTWYLLLWFCCLHFGVWHVPIGNWNLIMFGKAAPKWCTSSSMLSSSVTQSATCKFSPQEPWTFVQLEPGRAALQRQRFQQGCIPGDAGGPWPLTPSHPLNTVLILPDGNEEIMRGIFELFD